MHGKQYDEAKKEIRSVLLTYNESVSLEEFSRSYRSLLGQRLPSRDLGFSTDVAFLQSMPDVVDLKTDSYGKIHLNGIADEASQHIQKLVSRQRKTKLNNSKQNQFNARQPVHRQPSTSLSARNLKPFLPGALRAEFLEMMSAYSNGITLTAFAIAYGRKFKKYLNLPYGLNSLEAMIKLIPELEVEKNEKGERTIYSSRHLKRTGNQKGCYRNNESPASLANVTNAAQGKISSEIHKSGIPGDILKDFQKTLEKFPDGILNIHFPPLYEKVTGKEFNLVDLGYNSMADLVEALPHIFKRVSNRDDAQHWSIYPAESHVKQKFKDKQLTSDSPLTQHVHRHQEGITADVSSPILQYTESTMPDYINFNQYIPVFISAIKSPSLFWFQLQTDEYIEKLEKLEKDLENFYSNASYKYRMSSTDFAIGATCVVQCPDDHQWYRAVIKSIPSPELINVSFVDYGSRDNVPRHNVYYVWSKFHEYPAYAFKAQLANLRPAGNEESWSSEARKRFVQLCNCAPLMARGKQIDQDTYSVYLCDTNGDADIYLQDALINEGYAECCQSEQSPLDLMNSKRSDLDGITNNHDISVNSENGSSTNQSDLQSDNSCVFFETKELPVNRKLSFSTDLQNNVVQPNASHFKKDKTAKRYVKQIEICEDSKIHLISLENKLFMSCSELCSLLWREKNASLLIRNLKRKEVDIPFRHIKEEDYIELFKQCLWYKVPGFQKDDSDSSSVVLCPLEEAYNILNIFGHPSVCVRVIIQHEIRIFDPHDDFWNEFSYKEFLDLSDIESTILEEINKSCLYDLKMKNEAFRVQKLKLLRLNSNPPIKEIERIENILNVIERRMNQIKAICSQYSSCS